MVPEWSVLVAFYDHVQGTRCRRMGRSTLMEMGLSDNRHSG